MDPWVEDFTQQAPQAKGYANRYARQRSQSESGKKFDHRHAEVKIEIPRNQHHSQRSEDGEQAWYDILIQQAGSGDALIGQQKNDAGGDTYPCHVAGEKGGLDVSGACQRDFSHFSILSVPAKSTTLTSTTKMMAPYIPGML